MKILKSSEKKRWLPIPFSREDLPAIGLFFKELYNGINEYGSMGFFQWKIVDNYVQTGIINLIKDDNKIVSTTSITPKKLFIRGEVYDAAEIGDTYTHPNYWRQGMFSTLINQTSKDLV